MTALRILIVDDEQPARFGLAKALRQGDVEIVEAADGVEALERLAESAFDLVFLDLNMPRMGGAGVLDALSGANCRAEIIVLTANDSVQSAVDCIRRGAADYIAKPYEIEQVRAIARRVARRRELEDRVDQLESRLDESQTCGALLGASPAMQELFGQIKRAARANLDILIRGETGSGKELIAREIHRNSPRSAGPFVAVNTAAIAESLAESELFGHVRGAFTGADADRAGVFAQAHGGTLFLDEIGDMPLPAQTKILRVLQERAVQPVGSTKSRAIDVRVVTATHQDLEQAIAAGLFRQDLFYRIRGVELRVPPLRSRREDILLLARRFLERVAGDGPAKTLSADAADALLRHNWPGNVRELEQTIGAAAAMCEAGDIRARDLGLRVASAASVEAEPLEFADLFGLPLTDAKNQLVEAFERRAIERALAAEGGNVSAAARQLGIHRQNLQQKIAQLGLRRDA